MRLYLICPSTPLVSNIKVKESCWNRFQVWKPLSFMVLAGLTSPEWEIAIVDENLSTPNYEVRPRPDLVGITAFTSQATRACEISTYFRRQGAPLVMGGIHATICQEEARERVDAVVKGEERRAPRPQVLKDVSNGGLKRRYDGGLEILHADLPGGRV
jgi:B12 binding domain